MSCAAGAAGSASQRSAPAAARATPSSSKSTATEQRATPAAPGGAMSGTAAAFFDLDRTLMAGSSAYHFGRAMYKAGGLSRRQIARDALDQLRFRLRGSTDAGVNALLERVMASIKDQRVSDL